MNKLMMTAALFLTVAVSGALAQTGRTAPNAATPNATAPNSGIGTAIPQAPVGHRQPRRGEVAGSPLRPDPNDPVTREDAELNRKLKSICRGC